MCSVLAESWPRALAWSWRPANGDHDPAAAGEPAPGTVPAAREPSMVTTTRSRRRSGTGLGHGGGRVANPAVRRWITARRVAGAAVTAGIAADWLLGEPPAACHP